MLDVYKRQMTGSAILGTALLIGLVWLIWKGILWIRSKAGGKKKAGSAEPEPEAAPGEQMTGTSAAETDSNCLLYTSGKLRRNDPPGNRVAHAGNRNLLRNPDLMLLQPAKRAERYGIRCPKYCINLRMPLP